MSTSIDQPYNNTAVLMRVSRYAPIHCRALGLAVPYAVLLHDGRGDTVGLFDLDGEELPLDIIPTGIAQAAPDDVLAAFTAAWSAAAEGDI